MLLPEWYSNQSIPSIIRSVPSSFTIFVSPHTGENMMITPERKLKCYAVLWLLDNHAHLKQTVWWSTSLFSARPCSWTTRMWCCVVVCNLWGSITYWSLYSSSTDHITENERYRDTVWHVSRVKREASLCATTTLHTLCLFEPTLPFSISVFSLRIDEQSNL